MSSLARISLYNSVTQEGLDFAAKKRARRLSSHFHSAVENFGQCSFPSEPLMAHPESLHEPVKLAVRHARQLLRVDFDVGGFW